jgi:hypothetical protein
LQRRFEVWRLILQQRHERFQPAQGRLEREVVGEGRGGFGHGEKGMVWQENKARVC